MADPLLVSIIITTYGNPVKLRRAIDSVLAQTYKDIEIIVVDDNDPASVNRKTTEKVINVYSNDKRVVYVKHEKNMNGSAARNTGLRNAGGEYIAFLDNDDVYLPERIKESVELLEREKDCEGVFTQVLIGSYGSFDDYVSEIDTEKLQYGLLAGKSSIGTGSNLFFSRKAVDEVGFFDERFTRFQDLEYVIRFLDKYKAGMINEILIIKDGDGRNVPSYKKMKKNDELFLQKFASIIKQYDVSKQKIIYEYHAADLYRYAVECFGSKSDIKHEKARLEKYRKLTDSEKNSYRLYIMIRMIKKLKNCLKSNNMVKKIFAHIKMTNKSFSEFKKYKVYLEY